MHNFGCNQLYNDHFVFFDAQFLLIQIENEFFHWLKNKSIELSSSMGKVRIPQNLSCMNVFLGTLSTLKLDSLAEFLDHVKQCLVHMILHWVLIR